MNRENLINELKTTFEELSLLIGYLSEDEFNKVPFFGGWTAGQLARHVIKSASGFSEIIEGPASHAERNPDLHVDSIITDFMNFDQKTESPSFVLPEQRDYNKNETLMSLEYIRERIITSIEILDLTKICTSFEVPVLGFLSRLEAVNFVIYHTKRHIHQLKKIISALKNGRLKNDASNKRKSPSGFRWS